MNCFAGPQAGRRTVRGAAAATAGDALRHGRRGTALLMLLAASGCAAAQTAPAEERVYDLLYTVTPAPQRGTAEVELALRQPQYFLREVSMDMPGGRYSDIHGDGELERSGDRVSWLPPQEGGSLRWTVNVAHRRNGRDYDAWLGPDWALLRATDIMPPAQSRTLKGARSRTALRFELPSGWSAVTQYRERDGLYRVSNDERRFDRPAGWMLLGRIGVRIETISGVRVIVAGPTGQDVRRMDILALLNWTLPQVIRILPDFPQRLTIVSAADSMWRGGLSGPRSLYIHAELPLLSENATSPLLHEVLHVGTGLSAADGADWIVEGLAEYYGLEILRRSRTITRQRFNAALEDLADWARDSDRLCSGAATGATTARAVGVFAALHRELRAQRDRPDPLDDLLRRLVARGDRVTVASLRRIATDLHGELPQALAPDRLPGCR